MRAGLLKAFCARITRLQSAQRPEALGNVTMLRSAMLLSDGTICHEVAPRQAERDNRSREGFAPGTARDS